MAEGSTNEKLRQAFEDHLEDTREHVRRLEEIRTHLNVSTAAECRGMRGLTEEGEAILEGGGTRRSGTRRSSARHSGRSTTK
jgi:ferritin-like metal-binding protein YciE